ncbi:ABC1 kinase family protein [Gordonia sp. NPDC127522]|uniref:ABC1 kinase family protein n=1 Tax=Gordonia sp. NPDC127522 TaxID=3345390 RepID=UPI00362BA710
MTGRVPSRDDPGRPGHVDRFAEVRAGRVRRTIPVVGFAARSAGGRVVAELRARNGDTAAVSDFHRRTAERYADLLGHSKGVLMKAGQLMSTYDADRAGPLSVYQQALQRLQADAPPMDERTAREVVETELGMSVDEAFAEFAATPMAAASIGQVHRGRLVDGREVAVKVQYPGVAQAIRDDLANTELLATFLRLGMSLTPRQMRTDQRAAAAEIAERIAEEVDYRHEAHNVTRFATLYRDHPFIRVPDVIADRSTAKVLTMTYLDGIDWTSARSADADLRNRWATSIGYFSFGAYRHSNLFNADPHPGNYRFGADGSVGFVDFGCVKQFPEWVRRGIITLFRAAVDDERDKVYHLARDHGFIGRDSDLTVDDVFGWWSMMSATVRADQPHTFESADVSEVVRSFFDADGTGATTRKMTIPSDYVMLARINLGINAIFSELGATIDTREMTDVLDGVPRAPTTEAGRQHSAWIERRGLPRGLDAR